MAGAAATGAQRDNTGPRDPIAAFLTALCRLDSNLRLYHKPVWQYPVTTTGGADRLI
jgi:hypothetical protein